MIRQGEESDKKVGRVIRQGEDRRGGGKLREL